MLIYVLELMDQAKHGSQFKNPVKIGYEKMVTQLPFSV